MASSLWCFIIIMTISWAFVPYDDFHYPSEEPQEFASAVIPLVLSIGAKSASAVLKSKSSTLTVKVGDLAFDTWHVLGILTSTKPSMVVLECEFTRWGLIALVSVGTSPVTLRKSIGTLDGIKQPYFNFTGTDPQYFTKVKSVLNDFPSQLAMNNTKYGELDFPSAAAVLAPQRDIADISNAADVVKFVVTYNGRIKCAKTGITEYEDQHAAPPNTQTIVFDPAEHLKFWPTRFENSKIGFVGGHLKIANVGAFSKTQKKGYELMAFSPVFHPNGAPIRKPKVACKFSGPFNYTYVKDCSQGCLKSKTLSEAEKACSDAFDCGGITLAHGNYELRRGNATIQSPTSETSWLVTNSHACHNKPRLPNINYSPGVFVRLREQESNSFGKFQYFYVSNTTNATLVDEEMFYTKMVEYQEFYQSLLSQGMKIKLPDFERRQVDMAKGALLSTLNNYVGNQPNYGNGATYWSYAREDNGSLPLNILSVDDALLDWGLCDIALAHIGFYFDNYVRDDGTINYYTWGGFGDSISDYGRLVDLYLKAVRLCHDVNWNKRYLSTAVKFGELLLNLRKAAINPPTPAPPGCEGLLQGPPEHDWHSTTNLYFYNNNVWTLRGMEILGAYLSTGPNPPNTTLGKALLADAKLYRADIDASVAAVRVKDSQGKLIFFPPYSQTNFTPFKTMTDSRTSSYSNFRFYPEVLLADVLPRDVESILLFWHNSKGGRLGGTSRWSSHLDDMPTAGWGYGAITNNKTLDFLALLYGHMANYQSRGTFHSTEQLSFQGEGFYRNFLHWPNPPDFSSNNPNYYGQENDISFCIVSEIIVARMTRWQLVFEDIYRDQTGSIWLARGAPKRWFQPNAGFSVTNAPTQIGLISFDVSIPRKGSAKYVVKVPTLHSQNILWKLRWPGQLIDTPTCDTGCRVNMVERDAGIVTVVIITKNTQELSFQVTANVNITENN